MADTSSDHHDANSLHIVVFPFMAFSHILPYLDLSKSLARRGHRISFISTPRNIRRLPTLPPDIAHLIDLVAFDLPKVEGLRDAAEATADLPPEEVPYLKKACDELEQPFRHFIKHVHPKPDWIVHDYVQHWVPSVAAELGIPCIYYFVISAAAQVYHGRGWEPSSRPLTLDAFLVAPPWVPFPSKVAYRLHELITQHKMTTFPNPSGIPELDRLKTTVEGSRAVVVRSSNGLESEYLSLLGDIFKKPVIPLGLLPPPASERTEINANGPEAAVMSWLDEQRSGSVIYVALGSEAAISVDQLHELALGLEAARLPFLWGLERPSGLKDDIADMLPRGFEDRTKGLGMVVTGRVPHLNILAHESVGGFLTHCGWSSVIEGLQWGHPFVMLPLAMDQGLNARLVEEKGLGFEVERNEADGCFTRDHVSKAVRVVMVDKEGEPYRKKAREMKEIVTNGERQDKYVDDFVQYLVTHRTIDG